MSNNTMDASQAVPELGDMLTILSDIYKSTTGRIIYRDGAMIRIRPAHVSDRAVDFPLDPATGLFQDSLGVSEIILHEKAKYPHYARQLGVLPGESLEFYSADGQPSADPGVVAAIVADDANDAIQLEDGRILNFGFLGAPAPYTVIVPRSAPEDFGTTNNNTEVSDGNEVAEEEDIFELPEIVLPAPLVEEIPTSERTYSDAVQREDMFVSLLLDIPQAKQKNPRVLRNLYRKTDLLLALKNSMVVRDVDGSVLADKAQTYVPNTLSDLLPLQTAGAPVAALLPVADVKKVVYVDDNAAAAEGAYEDVDVRVDSVALAEASASTKAFRGGEGATTLGNPFLSYMDFLLARNLPAVVPRSQQPATWIQVDQDVLRSRVPPAPVQGFPTDLPPAVVAKGDAVDLTPEFLATVGDRTVRLLSATTVLNRRTGTAFQIAPADSGEVVDHVLLSADVAAARAPTRSSVLLWDMQASDASRRQGQAFYTHLMARWDAQRVVGQLPVENAELATILADRIPAALQLAERPVLQTLDMFGMRALEINQPLMDVLAKALLAGRTAWDTAMVALRKRAIAALTAEATPIPSPISEGNPLWLPAVEGQEDIAPVLGALKDREPTLAGTHGARTAYMLSVANGTLVDVWYAAAGEAAEAAMQEAVSTYRAERRRLDRATANTRAAEAAIAATPAINECQHVYLLESIRSIREEAKRYAVLQDFLTKYQGGVRGNWVICGSCEKNLICRHELMLLHEFLHPGRSVALHKTLLLEFSGPVFEGAYICKNCGQKIAELEFDTHLEFDDEGRPLIGRAIVAPTKKKGSGAEEDEGAEGTEEDEEGVERFVLAEEAKEKDSLGYEGTDLKNYYVVRTVLEHCGITPTKELYARIVNAARDFLAFKLPNEKTYTMAMQRQQAAKKTGKDDVASYERYVANMTLAVIGALIVLEIQAGDFAIPFPAFGCKLERGGFPLEKTGFGCLTYVTCVVAGVLRNDAPWNMATWTGETSIPKRQSLIATDMRTCIALLLALPGPTGKGPAPLTTVTDTYKSMLDAKRAQLADTGATNDAELNISADRIPPAFRPIPMVRPPREEESAVPNKSKLLQDVREGPLTEVKAYVGRRQQDVIQEALHTFHKESLASARGLHILSEANPRSDAACCFQRLGAAALRGHGVTSLAATLGAAKAAEMELLEESAKGLRKRDPAASANGTHIYVPWSAPIQRSILPEADPSMYYKLFVKNCFRGENLGFPHEYGSDWICRHCRYACPAELEYLTGAELGGLDGKKFQKALEELEAKRQQLAIASLEGQVSEESFHALEDAIHTRKSVTPYRFPTATPLSETLESMRQQLLGAPMSAPQMQGEWAGLQDVMARIGREGLRESPRRRQAMAGFTRASDDVRGRLEARFLELLGARPSEAMKTGVTTAIEAMLVVSERVEAAQGARNVVTFLLTPMEQVATGFVNEKPRVAKWFPKVARSHRDLLHTIWDAQNTVARNGNVALKELKPAVREEVVAVMRRLTGWLGPWIQHWIHTFRPTEGPEGFSASETKTVLQWSLGHLMLACVVDESPLWVGLATDVRRAAAKWFQGFFVDAFRVARGFVEKTQMTPKQIQEALLARQELERAEFIRRFDVLDRDMRRVELIKKRLKIGDWAVGTMKNLFQYDADFFEFERGQRAAMGLPEFAGDITGDSGGAARENPYGFMEFGEERVAVGINDHRGTHDEDAI